MSHAHHQSRSPLWPGVPLALGSAALFGAAPPLSKLLLAQVSPFLLAGLLYLGAGVGLGAFRLLWKSGGETAEAGLGRADLPWLLCAVATGGVAAPVLLLLGLCRMPASSGALLLNLESLATMLIAWVVYRENVDRRLLLGAFAILAGAALLSWSGRAVSLDGGALLIAAACVAWGLDNNVTRRISAADPVVIVLCKGLAAGSVNIGLGLATGAALPALPVIGAAALVGFFAVGVSLVLFIRALRHLGTARTGAYYALAPFIAALLGVGLLGEPLTLKLVLAGGLMGLGLWLHLSERHDHWHEHEALEHAHAHVHDAHHQHRHNGPVTEPHTHRHRHEPLRHKHPHFPDLHHRHGHG